MTTRDSWLRNDGLSIYEIAKLLGVTPRAVQKVEANALAKLRRHPRALREFLGINDHLGESFETNILAGGRSSREYLTTSAPPAPKEGQHR